MSGFIFISSNFGVNYLEIGVNVIFCAFCRLVALVLPPHVDCSMLNMRSDPISIMLDSTPVNVGVHHGFGRTCSSDKFFGSALAVQLTVPRHLIIHILWLQRLTVDNGGIFVFTYEDFKACAFSQGQIVALHQKPLQDQDQIEIDDELAQLVKLLLCNGVLHLFTAENTLTE